jgi:hypothetical protein
VREYGTVVCGEVWQDKVYNREEWKKLRRTTTDSSILKMARG